MATLTKRGRNWFYRFTDADGRRVMRKGCSDRRETERLAAAAESEAAKIKAGLIDPKAVAYRDHDARDVSAHLDDYQAALLAKGGTAKHAAKSRNRAARVLTLAKVRRVTDLSLSRVQAGLAAIRAEGVGPETVNHHVRAVKAFSRWLWRDGRTREHYLAHLATATAAADVRRRRRALTPAEATRLIQVAAIGPMVKRMTGPDRARLYALALGTGFRASELASLTPDRFNLSADPPTVTVPAAYTKNKREAVQPIAPALAAMLAPWVATLPAGEPAFRVPDRTADMIRVDLKAAAVPFETPAGRVDFHALRVTFISYVVAGKASVKVCQELARHSTPILTIGLYAKADADDMQDAVATLPDFTPPDSTAGTSDKKTLAPLLLHSGDASRLNMASVGRTSVSPPGLNASTWPLRNPLKDCGLDARLRGHSHSFSKYRRWESNPHGSNPPGDFKSPASAFPPRRLWDAIGGGCPRRLASDLLDCCLSAVQST